MIRSGTYFRYDINALRAIAVIAVVCYHYKVGLLGGGFSGVDVFFVISGYLMTGIIRKSQEQHTFSYFHFLRKRLQRIAPALIFLVLLISLAGFFIYFPRDFKINAGSALASLLFYSNIQYLTTGYFDTVSELNIFLHTWSLSVEFQFYLLYPLLLIALRKRLNTVALEIFIPLTVFFFAVSVLLSASHPVWSFYLLPTRSWELLAGTLVFFVKERFSASYYSKYLALTGYILLATCFVTLKSTMIWPGLYTLLPVAATCMVIYANHKFLILETKLIQLTGQISYSLYLWHWPVFVIARYTGFEITPLSQVVLLLISFVMASMSYKLIEDRPPAAGRLVVVTALSLLIVFCCTRFNLNQIMFRHKTLAIADYEVTHTQEKQAQFSEGKCFISGESFKTYDKALCLGITADRPNILLIGDSHAAQLSASLRKLLEARHINLLQSTASGCLPLLRNYGSGGCTRLIDYIYRDFIVHHAAHIDGVLLTANWARGNYDKEILTDDLSTTLRYLKKYKLKVLLIGQTECYTIPYPDIVAREVQYNTKVSQYYINPEGLLVNKILRTDFPEYYVNIYNAGPAPGLKLNQVPYLFDENHMSPYGADLALARIFADPLTIRFFAAARQSRALRPASPVVAKPATPKSRAKPSAAVSSSLPPQNQETTRR